MKRRTFNTLSLISALLLACTTVLWGWSFWADMREDRLSISDNFHMGAYRGRLEFFSLKIGPYHGSSTIFDETKDTERGFGDTLGVYYRYLRFADSGDVIWTLSVSLFYPMIVFAVLPMTWAWLWWQRAKLLPLACQREPVPLHEMFWVISLYWWVGILGIACLTVASGVGIACVSRQGFLSWESFGIMAGYCFHAGVFGTSLYVARRLLTKPDGMLPYDRMVGIVLATMYFPILTIPGIICVQGVTKHFAAHCESVANQSKVAL